MNSNKYHFTDTQTENELRPHCESINTCMKLLVLSNHLNRVFAFKIFFHSTDSLMCELNCEMKNETKSRRNFDCLR